MADLQIFEHEVFGQIRVLEVNGEPWFVAADVCRVLELGNSRQALTRLDEDEKGVISTDTPGGKQEMNIVNEAGLYSLVLGSRKPEGKAFKRWITHEVLPSIRQTGTYGLAIASPAVEHRVLTTDDFLKAALIVSNCRNERLPYVLGFLEQGGFSIAQVKATEPPAYEVTRVINDAINEHGFTVAQLCKITGLDRVQLNRYRRCASRPRKDRATYLVQVISDAVNREDP